MNLHSSPTTCCYVTFLYRVVENTLQITAAAAEYLINVSLELSNESDTHISFLSGQTRVTLKIPLDVVTKQPSRMHATKRIADKWHAATRNLPDNNIRAYLSTFVQCCPAKTGLDCSGAIHYSRHSRLYISYLRF